MSLRCKAIKTDGMRCEAGSEAKRDFCSIHGTPEQRTERDLKKKVRLRSVNDVLRLAEETVNQLRFHMIDDKGANAIGKLAMVALHCIKADGEGIKKREAMAAVQRMGNLTPEQIADIFSGKRNLEITDAEEDSQPN